MAFHSQIALKPADYDRSQRELLNGYAAGSVKIVSHRIRRCGRIQERQHAIKKTSPPLRIEPAIDVRRRQMICRKRELPSTGFAPVERAGPTRAERRG